MAGVPSYCRPDPRCRDDRPVRLRSHLIRVPRCTRGHHHREHLVKVRIGGRGFPLVVAHGYTGESRVYLLLLGLLARWFKVIAIDLAGHGGTPNLPHATRMAGYADLLACTLEALGIQRCILVGHSLGGRVVAEAAAMSPAQVAGVILVNAIVGEPWDQRIAYVRWHPCSLAMMAWKLGRDIQHLLDNVEVTDGAPTLRELSADTLARHRTHPWALLPTGWAFLYAPPSAPILGQLHAAGIHVVVVWSDSDPLVSEAMARSTAALAGGGLIIVDRADHNWPLANRDSLPDIMRWELEAEGGSGTSLRGLLDSEVSGAGLDPTAATPDQVEGKLYTPGALAIELTPPYEHLVLPPRITPEPVKFRHMPTAL